MTTGNSTNSTMNSKDKLSAFLRGAHSICLRERDLRIDKSKEISTGALMDDNRQREWESVLEEMNRYQFAADQLEILIRYLG